MARLKAYSNTTVSLFKTQDDTERLLSKHGIAVSRWTHLAETDSSPGTVRFEFEWRRGNKAPLGFRVDLEYQYVAGPKGGNQGTTREQAGRALYWHVKNLLDAVDFGIVELEQAFLPHLLTASGRTVYEEVEPKLESLPSIGGLLGLPPGDSR